MKRILPAIFLLYFLNNSFGQDHTYRPKIDSTKNCFDEYYHEFSTRGALPVPDGEHNVVFSLRTDTGCICVEGKLSVNDGKIVPYAMIKRADGTYSEAKTKLQPVKNNPREGTDNNALTISKGMSQTFLTATYGLANVFFVEYLKPPLGEMVTAPDPKGINNKPAAVTEKEKEIIKEAYDALLFENGKTKIRSSSFVFLDKVANMLKEKPEYKLTLTGYTDDVGSSESNLKLSKGRAEATKNYLIKKGVSADRLAADGFGEANPIGDNNTPEGRAKNRRVEFLVTQ
jgi:outer membrane protein OmpA-like peptidoglycan-associated protein